MRLAFLSLCLLLPRLSACAQTLAAETQGTSFPSPAHVLGVPPASAGQGKMKESIGQTGRYSANRLVFKTLFWPILSFPFFLGGDCDMSSHNRQEEGNRRAASCRQRPHRSWRMSKIDAPLTCGPLTARTVALSARPTRLRGAVAVIATVEPTAVSFPVDGASSCRIVLRNRQDVAPS